VSKSKSVWRLWAYALGQKEGRSNKEADVIAAIRTLIMIQLVTTNGFIIANAIRHWNNVPSELPKTEEKGLCKPQSNILKD
jgi:hypothetical protein